MTVPFFLVGLGNGLYRMLFLPFYCLKPRSFFNELSKLVYVIHKVGILPGRVKRYASGKCNCCACSHWLSAGTCGWGRAATRRTCSAVQRQNTRAKTEATDSKHPAELAVSTCEEAP